MLQAAKAPCAQEWPLCHNYIGHNYMGMLCSRVASMHDAAQHGGIEVRGRRLEFCRMQHGSVSSSDGIGMARIGGMVSSGGTGYG